MSTFADRFKKERLNKNLTQAELADKFHTDKSSISKYENGHSMPELPILQEYAEFFGVSIDYLLGNTNERSSADKIKKALTDDPELSDAWEKISQREDLQLLFKQTKDMDESSIRQVIRIIKAIEDEEANNGI